MILHNSTTVKQLHRLALYQLYEGMGGGPGILFQGVSSSHEEKLECCFYYFHSTLFFKNTWKYGVNLEL